jgi:four helix bundle protein
MREFRKLIVWQRAHALHIAIDEACQQVRQRRFANLKTQLSRAAESIPANIVEGCASDSKRDFARYLGVSIKSANETEYHLLAASERGALPSVDVNAFMSETVEVRKMLYGLRKRLLSDDE